jgi:hypothetical protein
MAMVFRDKCADGEPWFAEALEHAWGVKPRSECDQRIAHHRWEEAKEQTDVCTGIRIIAFRYGGPEHSASTKPEIDGPGLQEVC